MESETRPNSQSETLLAYVTNSVLSSTPVQQRCAGYPPDWAHLHIREVRKRWDI
jgi:hypothetical protein